MLLKINVRIHREYMWWLFGVLQKVCVFGEIWRERQKSHSCGVAALASKKAGYREKLDIEDFPILCGADKLELGVLV